MHKGKLTNVNPPRITTEPLNQELVSPLIASKLLITGVE
jgi:hypothetical protein